MPTKKYSFQCYSEETYHLLYQLHKKGIISAKAYIEFGECKNFKQIFQLIKDNFSIKEEMFDKIWRIIRQNSRYPRLKKKEWTVFNEFQTAFMIELIDKNNGIYTKEQCQMKVLTDSQIYVQIKILEEMDYIKSLKTSKLLGEKTIYIISPTVIQECQN